MTKSNSKNIIIKNFKITELFNTLMSFNFWKTFFNTLGYNNAIINEWSNKQNLYTRVISFNYTDEIPKIFKLNSILKVDIYQELFLDNNSILFKQTIIVDKFKNIKNELLLIIKPNTNNILEMTFNSEISCNNDFNGFKDFIEFFGNNSNIRSYKVFKSVFHNFLISMNNNINEQLLN